MYLCGCECCLLYSILLQPKVSSKYGDEDIKWFYIFFRVEWHESKNKGRVCEDSKNQKKATVRSYVSRTISFITKGGRILISLAVLSLRLCTIRYMQCSSTLKRRYEKLKRTRGREISMGIYPIQQSEIRSPGEGEKKVPITKSTWKVPIIYLFYARNV